MEVRSFADNPKRWVHMVGAFPNGANKLMKKIPRFAITAYKPQFEAVVQ